MILRFIVFLFLLGIAELTTLLWLASHMGWLSALAEVMVTLVIGLAVIRWEGLLAWIRLHETILRNEDALDHSLDALLLLVGAIFLMVPGLITDCVGILLIFPPSRVLLRFLFLRQLEKKFFPARRAEETSGFSGAGEPQFGSDEIIDVEFYRIS
ncbi:MAG: FxsA family protein [Thermogutta sp.]